MVAPSHVVTRLSGGRAKEGTAAEPYTNTGRAKEIVHEAHLAHTGFFVKPPPAWLV
jgi:hypothetical protein